jgi:hypothetical protein
MTTEFTPSANDDEGYTAPAVFAAHRAPRISQADVFLLSPVSLRHLDISYLGHCFSFSKDNRSFVVVLSPRRGKTLSMLCWCARESISVIASITRTT